MSIIRRTEGDLFRLSAVETPELRGWLIDYFKNGCYLDSVQAILVRTHVLSGCPQFLNY